MKEVQHMEDGAVIVSDESPFQIVDEAGRPIMQSRGRSLMIFGPDNSGTRPVRDILVFHPLEGDDRYAFLRDVWKTMQLLGEGLIHANNTAMIEYGHGLDTIGKVIESLTSQFSSYERDIMLLLTEAAPGTDSIIVKTNDGLMFIGPNDGSLGFLPPETITGMWRITAEPDKREITRRTFAAAKIAAGRNFEQLGEAMDVSKLINI